MRKLFVNTAWIHYFLSINSNHNHFITNRLTINQFDFS